MRTITLIIIHCSGTPDGKELSFEACRADHIRHRHFKDIGYHYYITRDGKVHKGRAISEVGAHCQNHNAHSIGICYEGGLDSNGDPRDTRTPAQRATLRSLIRNLKKGFPRAIVLGHRDLNLHKDCPCFNAYEEYR